MKVGDAPKVLIIDLCHTLIAENTTKTFLDDWLLTSGWRQTLRKSILGRMWPTCLLGLCGLSKQFLYEQADAYVRDRLMRFSIPTTLKAVLHARQRGIPVYIASASIDPIVAAVVKQLKLNGAVCSRLLYGSNGRCTGIFQTNVTGRKLTFLRQILPESVLREAAVYTDNSEDTDILCASRHPHFLGDRQALSALSDHQVAKIAFLSQVNRRDIHASC